MNEEGMDDLMEGYRETAGMRQEYFSPEMAALRETGFDPLRQDAWAEFKEKAGAIETEPESDEEVYARRQRKKGIPEKEIAAETGGLQEPTIQNPAEMIAGVGGQSIRMSLAAGERLFPMLVRAVTQGTTAAVTEVPIGQATAKIEEKYPWLTTPLSIGLGVLSGATIERAMEKGMVRLASGRPLVTLTQQEIIQELGEGRALKEIEVERPAIGARTGKTSMVKEDAETALKDIDSKINAYTRLMECMNA